MLIGYARISTTDQSLDLQLDALCKAGCSVIFEDAGISGVKSKRPGLDKLLKRLNQGDVLVVWKLDRLGRSVKHLIELTSVLEARGVGFQSLSDAIDTSTAGGRLYFHLIGAFAEFERNLISERTKAGMAAAKARGVRLGRPKKLSQEQRTAISKFEGDRLDAAAEQLGTCANIRHSETVQ